jgi:hypothetical protein
LAASLGKPHRCLVAAPALWLPSSEGGWPFSSLVQSRAATARSQPCSDEPGHRAHYGLTSGREFGTLPTIVDAPLAIETCVFG